MKKGFSVAVIGLAGVVGMIGPPATGETILEDFESYHDGQIIGSTATSKPWSRFGAATNDNMVATSHERWVISGSHSAIYGLVWPNSFGAVRYRFDQATDLSPYHGVAVKMRSSKNNTHTQVKLAISNGYTTFVSVADRPLGVRVQPLVFELGPTQMIRVVGRHSYREVVQGAWQIGFDFSNIEDQDFETIAFDQLTLTTLSDAAPKTKVSALE